MVKVGLGALAILLAITVLHLVVAPVVAQQPSLSYIYRLRGDGSLSATVVVTGLAGLVEYSFPVSESVVNESLVAFNEQGDIVLATYNGTHITVYPMNTTDKVVVQYEALAGEVIDGYIRVNITVLGPATIMLPEGAGLIYFTDNPSIEMVGGIIKLRYNASGTIQLEYVVAETETPTTTPTNTTATAPTTTTPTNTSTTTTTTSPVPQSPIGTTTSPTPSTQPTTTFTQTPTETPTTLAGTTTTETVQPPSAFPFTIVAVFIAVIIVLLVVGVLLYKVKFSKTYFLPGTKPGKAPSTPPGPSSTGEVVLMEHKEVDERDRLILLKLSERPMSISELARELGLSKSTVWRRIRKLEKEGYVVTRGEGKKIVIELTDKARKLLGS